MNFVKYKREEQQEFLKNLESELPDNKALKLYRHLQERFYEYCYGIKNIKGDFESMVYFLPAVRPVVIPPLVIPSLVKNIELSLKMTCGFIITEINKLLSPEQIIFLLKEDTKTGKGILSIMDINNGKLYNPPEHIVIGVIPERLDDYNHNLLKEVEFKQWKDIGDEYIEKLLDSSFEGSLDKKISSGSVKKLLRKDFKSKKISRNNCIVMGKDGKAIGIAFPYMIKEDSNINIVFGSAYYFGVLPKYRAMGYSNILLASCMEQLIKFGCNTYKGRVSPENEQAVRCLKKFDMEVYDSIMIVDIKE